MLSRYLWRQTATTITTRKLLQTSNVAATNNHLCQLHLTSQLGKKKGKDKSKASKKQSAKQLRDVLRVDDVIEFIDLDKVNQEMVDVVENMKEEFATNIRLSTDVSLFENITMEIDGEVYSLNEVADVSQPNPRLVTVDMTSYPEYLKQAEDALRSLQHFNLNPLVSGTEIKVPLPQATPQQSKSRIKQAETVVKKAARELDQIKNQAVGGLTEHDHLPKDSKYLIEQQIDVYIQNHNNVMQKALESKKKSLKI